MIAGIVIDNWKQDIFERTLRSSGFKYEIKDGISLSEKLIKVNTDNVGLLAKVVERANQRAALSIAH